MVQFFDDLAWAIATWLADRPKISALLVALLIAIIEAIFGIRLGEPIADTAGAVT